VEATLLLVVPGRDRVALQSRLERAYLREQSLVLDAEARRLAAGTLGLAREAWQDGAKPLHPVEQRGTVSRQRVEVERRGGAFLPDRLDSPILSPGFARAVALHALIVPPAERGGIRMRPKRIRGSYAT
jgi:hypothetical protein